MQWFKEIDGGNPNGTAKDRVGLTAGTTYLAKYWNDNFFNIFDFVTGEGYNLIDDDLEQFTKVLRGKYNSSYTYNTSGIATQTISDIVLGSDGLYYEAQVDALTGEDPVGSVTGNWKVKNFENIVRIQKTLQFTFSGDANQTLTSDENTYGRILISGAVISIQRDLITDNEEKFFTVQNDESFDVNVKTSAGTGIIVTAGASISLYNDGTNIIVAIVSASSGVLTTNDFLHIQDQRASTTSGGTFTAGSKTTRLLNTILTNTITGASLSSNQFTLPAGDYYIEASAPALSVDTHMCFIDNISDVVIELTGTSERALNANAHTTRSFVSGLISVASTKIYEVKHQCETTRATDGYGKATSFSTPHEVYTEIKVWKVG